jgi:hypothetical protein
MMSSGSSLHALLNGDVGALLQEFVKRLAIAESDLAGESQPPIEEIESEQAAEMDLIHLVLNSPVLTVIEDFTTAAMVIQDAPFSGSEAITPIECASRTWLFLYLAGLSRGYQSGFTMARANAEDGDD